MDSSLVIVSPDLLLAGTKKPHLRKAFNLLKTHASTVANFTLQWQDLEDHCLSIQNSIQTRFKQLQQQSNSQGLASSHETHFTPTVQSLSESKETADDSIRVPQGKAMESHLSATIEAQAKLKGNQLASTNASVAKSDESHLLPKEFQNKNEFNAIPVQDGKALLVYLVENLKQHESMRFNIRNALKASAEPGKLALEAMKWFHPLEHNNGDMQFDISDIRRSCVLLLEELSNAEPSIKPWEKEEAMKLASEWNAKLKIGVENSLQVFGFLQLLSAFGLAGNYDADELLKHIDTVVQRRQAPQLLRSLGLADKASDFIQKLISRDKQIEAIGFIHEFGLVDKFPLVPLLKDHYAYARKAAKIICRKGKNSPNAQDQARNKEIASLRAITTCIEKYKLESDYSPINLRNRLKQLRKQKQEKKPYVTTLSPERELRKQSGNKRAAPASESQWNKKTLNKNHSTTVPNEAAPNVFVDEASIAHSIQPYHHQPVGYYAAQTSSYSIPSARHSGQALTSNYTNLGTASSIYVMQPSHLQSASSAADHGSQVLITSPGLYGMVRSNRDTSQMISSGHAYSLSASSSAIPNASSTGRHYGLTGSISDSQNISLTGGSFQLTGGDRIIPHMGSTGQHYRMQIVENESDGRSGLDGITYSTGVASNVNSSRSIPYYPEAYPRMPNHNDEVSTAAASHSSGGYSGLSQRPPSIYHL